MNDPRLERAHYLLEVGRIEAAVQCLQEALADDPDDGLILSAMARALLDLKKPDEADDASARAIRAEPELAEAWQARCCVFLYRGETKRALEMADEAIRVDPTDAEGHALRASALFGRKKWLDALESANRALDCDPEHEYATHLRAMALRQSGDVAGARETMAEALRRNPDDPNAHVNEGWSAMHAGDYDRARTHFREALRLEPGHEYAREGLREALSAKHWFYRPVLRFFLWVGKLESVWAVAVMIGGYLVFRFAVGQLDGSGAARPWLLAFVILYLLFVEATWFASTFSRALLCLSRDGRLVLTRRERYGALAITAVLVGAVLVAAFEWWRTGGLTGYTLGALLLAFSCKPVRMALDFRSPEGRLRMGAYAAMCVAFAVGLTVLFNYRSGLREAVWTAADADFAVILAAQGQPTIKPGVVSTTDGTWNTAVGFGTTVSVDLDADGVLASHAARLEEAVEIVRQMDSASDYAEMADHLDRQAERYRRWAEARAGGADETAVRQEVARSMGEHVDVGARLSARLDADEIRPLGGTLRGYGIVFGILCAWVSQFVCARWAARYE